MRKRIGTGIVAGLAALALMGVALHGRERHAALSPPAPVHAAPSSAVVSAPGRVEPVTEDVRLGSEITGKIAQMLVEEGDTVREGQLLAVLVNDDYRAQVASCEAQLAERQADERKTRNGARTEERREARAAATAAEAVLENARAEMERHQKLYDEGVGSREEAESYARAYKVAQAQHDQQMQHFTFVDEEAREEDQARAAAQTAYARAQLAEAQARYDKTFIRAPISGTILRRYHRAGESVTNSATSPDPIFAIGGRGTLRVRMDVDETDVGRVRVGDRAFVTADAFGDRKFWGHVVRIGGELGRKNVRTDEPTERVDTKILETLVELDDGHELPVGLRVDSFVVVSRP